MAIEAVAAKRRKKDKYSTASEEKHMPFTPICISIDGLFGTEKTYFVKRMAECIASDTQKPYSRLMHWLIAKNSSAILWASDLCICGTRYKVKSIDSIDSIIFS